MKIGLALTGGGIQALAYIGVIQSLNDSGINIDYIAGSGSASIFSSLYAIGMSSQEIKNISEKYYDDFTKTDKTRMKKLAREYMFGSEITIDGLIDGDKIENILKNITKNKTISNVNIPVALIATDMITSKECVMLPNKYKFFDKNTEYIHNISIAKAIRASMSIPCMYTNCTFDKYILFDGGTKNDLQVKTLKEMGADLVIVAGIDKKYKTPKNIVDTFIRNNDILHNKDYLNSQNLGDIRFNINTEDTTLLDVKEIDRYVNSGYSAMRKQADNIKKIINNVKK